jgi:hypothetical protein
MAGSITNIVKKSFKPNTPEFAAQKAFLKKQKEHVQATKAYKTAKKNHESLKTAVKVAKNTVEDKTKELKNKRAEHNHLKKMHKLSKKVGL